MGISESNEEPGGSIIDMSQTGVNVTFTPFGEFCARSSIGAEEIVFFLFSQCRHHIATCICEILVKRKQ